MQLSSKENKCLSFGELLKHIEFTEPHVPETMGRKVVKVDVQTSKTTSETARSLAWTDNGGTMTDNGGKISMLSPALRKVLAGLSIGQLMVVAVSAATLGAFVNSNVSII